MRLCAVQCRSHPGDVERNLQTHLTLARRGADAGADLVLFPELSLTGYEPRLARDLATVPGDSRLDGLQDLVDKTRVTVAVGAPLRARIGITIAMVILRPGRPRLVYAKQHLHESETPYFVEGRGFPTLAVGDATLAPAICYELSVPEHAATAAAAGADVYAASVAKTAVDARRAARALAETARRHAMATVMANSIGPCDGDTCAGGTAAWGRDGGLLAELDGATQGLLMLDAANGTAAVIHAER